jgi:hypothetical protein
MTTDWAYFVIATLHVDMAKPSPFAISAAVMSTGRLHRNYASNPMTRSDAMLMRWRTASMHRCEIATEVVYSPVDDPFQTGRISPLPWPAERVMIVALSHS